MSDNMVDELQSDLCTRVSKTSQRKARFDSRHEVIDQPQRKGHRKAYVIWRHRSRGYENGLRGGYGPNRPVRPDKLSHHDAWRDTYADNKFLPAVSAYGSRHRRVRTDIARSPCA